MDYQKYLAIALEFLKTHSPKVIFALVIVIVGKWVATKLVKLLEAILKKNNVDVTLITFLSSITYYALMVLVIIAAAGKLGINTTSFLTIVGAAGLAVGLALKDSLSNFSSGVMLILFRPFRVGDLVNTSGVSGKVHSITIFNTILNTTDNQRVIVPNSSVTSNIITNITANDKRRIDMVIGIGYDDDIHKAREVLTEILKAESRVLPDPAFTIAVSELGDSSVNFIVRPWVKTEDYWDVYWVLTEKIKLTFDEKGISIPYPQRDIHIHNANATTGAATP